MSESADDGVGEAKDVVTNQNTSASSHRGGALRSYTVEEKLLHVKRLKNKEISTRELSRQTGISRKRFYDWMKDEEKLMGMKTKRQKRRVTGGGRKPLYPEIDAALLKYFRSEREKGHSVTYTELRAFVNGPNLGVEKPPAFLVSDKYLFNWTRRNNIGSRRITHRGQIDLRTKHDVKLVLEEYFADLQQQLATVPGNKIFNMDEIPCYFDMARDTTLSFRGSKNVDGADTGYRKQRYTVCLCVSLDGRMLKAMIIFRGLKKVPLTVPNDKVVVMVSKSGSMDSTLAKHWLDKVFSGRGPYFKTTPSVLLWDSYGSHKREDVTEHLSKFFKSRAVFVPPKTTCMAQPLDVAVNAPFKVALKNEWATWLRDTPPEYTPSGYRKRPSYQAIVDMVAQAMSAIRKEVIERAFQCCGVAEKGGAVPLDLLNERLKDVLSGPTEGGRGLEERLAEDSGDDDGAGANSGDEVLEQRSADQDNSEEDFSDTF